MWPYRPFAVSHTDTSYTTLYLIAFNTALEAMSFLLDEEKTWIQRDFGLDRRLIKALSKLGFTYPTLVQSRCIPIALQGKDVLVRARTGSGQYYWTEIS